MNQSRIYPVVLCGGAGTRLWPLSRKTYPKQFSRLLGEDSLFQRSALRCTGKPFAKPIVVTGDPFRFIVVEQLAAVRIDPAAILIEPEPRNTAPAILSAALWAQMTDPEAMLLVLPSDHVIPDEALFRAAVLAGVPAAEAGKIVSFGITPDRPETGYGYLELAEPAVPLVPTPLRGFVEKPDLATAQALVADGHHLWNAGIFLVSARTLVEAFEIHAPETLAAIRQSVAQATRDLGLVRLDPAAWEAAENVSIDYAIMEKADNLVAVPYAGQWSDLGGWEAVWKESGPDAAGNVVSHNATALDCSGSLLRSEDEGLRLVGLGLTDIIAIAMPDAVLVAHKSQAQAVKSVVAALKTEGAVQAETFPRDHRPWGWFESLVMGPRFQVKRICVKPGGVLSLQSHHHRAEHWVVVEGTARVTVGDSARLVTENESVFVPLGAVHRLENPGKVAVMLIEVQTGTYLGEDDIIRYEDAYSRR